MSNKMQDSTLKSYTKKLYCPEHGHKFTYQCLYEHCTTPYICHENECIEGHFHAQNHSKLVIQKFQSKNYIQKLNELEQVVLKEDYASEAKKYKYFIDQLKNSMVEIYKDYKELHNKKSSLLVQLNKPFEISAMDKIDETVSIGKKLRNSLDNLRSKLNMNEHIIGEESQTNQNQNDSRYSESPLPLRSQQNSTDKKLPPTSDKINGQHANKISIAPISHEKNLDLSFSKLNGNPQEAIQLEQNDIQIVEIKKYDQETNKKPEQENKENTQPQSFEDLFTMSYKNYKSNASNTVRNGSNNNLTGSNLSPQRVNTSNLAEQRSFFLKQQLSQFLNRNIKNFNWNNTQQVYSSFQTPKPIQKFHMMLEGKKHLLFLFIGEDKVLGSYYPSRYPKLNQKLRNDNHSFLFIGQQDGQFIKFKAVPSQFHLTVTDKLYICHGNEASYNDGIRTFQKNLDQIYYCLPSLKFKIDAIDDFQDNSKKDLIFSGSMKVVEFYVLELRDPVKMDY